MKNKLVNISLFLIPLMTLSACSTSNAENLIREVNDATQKNNTLENASYVWSLSYEPGDFLQTAEGVFISRGEGTYDWTHKEYHGDGAHFAQTAEIDGKQYEMFSMDESGFNSEWEKVDRELVSARDLILPLFENPIEEEYLDDIIVTEANGKSYQFTYEQSYLEDSYSESIQDLEESIKELEEAGDQTEYIQALEQQIKNIENTDFSDPMFELEIDAEGYLTKYISSYTFSTPEEEPVTATIRYELRDYNFENAEDLLPDVD